MDLVHVCGKGGRPIPMLLSKKTEEAIQLTKVSCLLLAIDSGKGEAFKGNCKTKGILNTGGRFLMLNLFANIITIYNCEWMTEIKKHLIQPTRKKLY